MCLAMSPPRQSTKRTHDLNVSAMSLHRRASKPGVVGRPAKRLKSQSADLPTTVTQPAQAAIPSSALSTQRLPNVARPAAQQVPATSTSQVTKRSTDGAVTNSRQARLTELFAVDRARRAASAMPQRAIVPATTLTTTRLPPLHSLQASSRIRPLRDNTYTLSRSTNAAARAEATNDIAVASTGGKPPRTPCPPNTPPFVTRTNVKDVSSSSPRPRVAGRRLNPAVPSPIDITPPASNAAAKISQPGAEAIRFDRTLLPCAANLLLDLLCGIEQALPLISARRAVAEFAAVRKIVETVTRRSFTLRHLSQLAALVPEAVAVLPPPYASSGSSGSERRAGSASSGLGWSPGAKRSSDHLIVRLDDLRENGDGEKGTSNSAEVKGTTTRLNRMGGDTAVRSRRTLLHTRLYAHVAAAHIQFLRQRRIKDFHGNLWHPLFDLERHVPELPAPPLYPSPPPTYPRAVTPLDVAAPNSKKQKPADVDPVQNSALPVSVSQVVEGVCSDKEDVSGDAVPQGLLARVRRREMQRAEREKLRAEENARALLHRLPAAMDVVRSVLAVDRRPAMGWGALVSKVARALPQGSQRTDDEVEDILDAIVKHATVWCEKKPLGGPRGGYAFRILDDRKFATARASVLAEL